jgi:hypothetical protein
VLVPSAAPVFVRSGARLTRADGRDIRVGDQIEVWREPTPVGYGAVEGAPGAPTYEGKDE